VITADGSCIVSKEWPVYIAEFYGGQHVANMAFGVTVNDRDIACGDLAITRSLIAMQHASQTDSSGKKGGLASGVVEKDEMGYTGIQLFAIQMAPRFTYTAQVNDGPCTALFGKARPIDGLKMSFTTDAAGAAKDQEAWIPSIYGAETQSLTVMDCLAEDGVSPDSTGQCTGGTPVIMCYDLEIMIGYGKTSDEEAGTSNADTFGPGDAAAGTGGNTEARTSNESNETADGGMEGKMLGLTGSAGCGPWAGRYDSGMGKGPKGAKGSKHGIFGDFEDRDIDGSARCCLASTFRRTSTGSAKKGKSAAFKMERFETVGAADYAGLGLAISGGVVLIIAAAMNLHRRGSQEKEPAVHDATPGTTSVSNSVYHLEPKDDYTERTPMLKGEKGSMTEARERMPIRGLLAQPVK